MYPVSARFLARLAESHAPVRRATLLRTDGTVQELAVSGGTVTVDSGSATRRTCTVEVPDPALIPRTPADELAMYGARLRIEAGVEYGDGSVETVPLGVFRLDEVSGDVDEGPAKLSGKSLEAAVADDKLTAPYTATGNATTSITLLIRRSLPDAAVINRATSSGVGSRTWDVEADPWESVVELATALGAEVYADPDGDFVIAALPDLLTTDPVWTIAAGEGGVYVQAERGMTTDKVHNGVLARGENTSDNAPPVQYLAVDEDPTSPTWWGGPFGRRPAFYSSSTLTTTEACIQAARVRLLAEKAPNATADITSLPNPALEPGDVIRIVYPDGARELHQVQSLSIPLDIGGSFDLATISAKEDA
ncbi:MAG TPA: DUF5047 domain-containing protein [Streptomyces sp.]|nr:DUF5047 domain-containing protein [Streptomyces sp.]